MKKITLILALLIGAVASAQEPSDFGFFVKDRSVIWQRVFTSPAGEEALLDYLYGSGDFTDVVTVSDGISFRLAPRSIDLDATGVSRGSLSMYLSLYRMEAHGKIQIREGRYRVTIDHINFLDEPPVALETYALNRNAEFKPNFIDLNAALAIDFELTRLLEVKTPEDEDW